MWSKKTKFGLGGLIIFGAVLFAASQGQAALLPYDLEVPIGSTTSVNSVADYIDTIYQFLVGIAGVTATVMIMLGGWQWIFAGGNESAITSAKERITSAIIGLVLALASYLILFTINPALVELTSLNPSYITPATGCTDEESNTVSLGDTCAKDCQCKSVLDNRYGQEVPSVCQDDSTAPTCVVPDNNICAWQKIKAEDGSILEEEAGGKLGCDEDANYACLNKSHVPVVEGGQISYYIVEWYCSEYSRSVGAHRYEYTVGDNYSMCAYDSFGGHILWDDFLGAGCYGSTQFIEKANDEYN